MSLRYLPDHVPQVFLDSLLSARSACELFFSVIDQVDAQLARLGIAGD